MISETADVRTPPVGRQGGRCQREAPHTALRAECHRRCAAQHLYRRRYRDEKPPAGGMAGSGAVLETAR
ncbi:hypothetical protein KCP70_13275 [Salmonella enterica subsp. enterica]|nr:hypothetical protein KCP70_13275 [Salmonella enterica subsp. enterica]